VQAEAPAPENVPAGHARQEVAPAEGAKVPAEHGVHVTEPPVEKLPAAHVVHWVFPPLN
jgi:hypothetical protein